MITLLPSLLQLPSRPMSRICERVEVGFGPRWKSGISETQNPGWNVSLRTSCSHRNPWESRCSRPFITICSNSPLKLGTAIRSEFRVTCSVALSDCVPPFRPALIIAVVCLGFNFNQSRLAQHLIPTAIHPHPEVQRLGAADTSQASWSGFHHFPNNLSLPTFGC